ncbi:MAG: hypothetical protein AMJ61_01705 [Desulfobacterales bacterium SG8_35_2]|nr:MAG: hypothetical protein AMJ61_01705 [Desulfobacterales bacterium SG8_35_2]
MFPVRLLSGSSLEREQYNYFSGMFNLSILSIGKKPLRHTQGARYHNILLSVFPVHIGGLLMPTIYF